MKKHILLLAAVLLFSIPSFAQRGLSVGIDQSIGVGWGQGPLVYGSTGVAVEYYIMDWFKAGVGAGLRYGLPTNSYDAETGKKGRLFELDLPIFGRIGFRYGLIGASVDVGYSIGLLSVGVGSLVGNTYPKRYSGFFTAPHIDLYLGEHNALGVGIMLQNGSYEGKDAAGAAVTVNKMLPAVSLRFSRRF